MELIEDYKKMSAGGAARRVVTIGNFDGVHLGHRAVLSRARSEADGLGLSLAVLTFAPHPAEHFRPSEQTLRLVDVEQKAELLASSGVDLVLAQKFDSDFAGLEAERFASDVLVGALGAKVVIVGINFRFGRLRAGNIDLLFALGRKLGFEVKAEKLVSSGDKEISSSRIRRMLLEGDVASAARLLGRYHEVRGTVEKGLGNGAGLGFPTANLGGVKVLIPAPGIYAAYCDVGGSIHPAAAYIGDRPTLGAGRSVEAHLMRFDGDLYGSRVALKFVELLRKETRFESRERLIEQIGKDVKRSLSILEAKNG